MEFKAYCTRCKVQCQVRTITVQSLGVDKKKPQAYPALQSWIFNAVSVKSFLIFLTEKLGKENNDTEYRKVRHVALWTGAEICWILDHGGMKLSDELRGRLQYATSLHILSFGWLYQATTGLFLYHPVPKWHYLDHAISRGRDLGINPMTWSIRLRNRWRRQGA